MPLSVYITVVLLALLTHALVNYSWILRLLVGISPLQFFSRVRAPVITAFSTSSSSGTLPTSIATAEQTLGIPPKIAGFVLPLGATMNMNGTALFEGVTVIFLAQVFGVSLTLGQQAVVMVMCVITAVGAAGVPGGSLPLLVGIMAMFGVPAEGIALILGVDRILDMSRTTVNVLGDLVATAFIAARRVCGMPACCRRPTPSRVRGAWTTARAGRRRRRARWRRRCGRSKGALRFAQCALRNGLPRISADRERIGSVVRRRSGGGDGVGTGWGAEWGRGGDGVGTEEMQRFAPARGISPRGQITASTPSSALLGRPRGARTSAPRDP